ncbi:SidA/IucD/PvdA family monooxygenase [Kocuria sp. M1R5S2]|uniref:SidA/IucD/PvdA family monooxygenase n=1 Tax=Kocuria rhizosphaerae TaxID=3376285 RepID=UPI00379AFFE9
MYEKTVDVLMIGAGPANLALAIAIEESAPLDVAQDTLMLEQHPDVKWQRNMLLPWARSQVSFVKDLVTLRNPQSRFSFLNYLRVQGQLDEFVNLSTFNPYRWQLSAYQQWVADELEHVRIQFNARATHVAPRHAEDGSVQGWVTVLSDGTRINSRDLVIGIGRAARIPEVFHGLPAERVVHSTQYGSRMKQLPADARPHRPVVIGGAQSAAEMFMALHQDVPGCEPTMILRSIGLQNYQTSKFVNELFFPSFVDEFYKMPAETRLQVLEEMNPTNYAALAPPFLDEIYSMLFQQRMLGQQRSFVRPLTEVIGARMDGDDVVLDVRDRKSGNVEPLRCDMVFLGTGYDQQMPPLVCDIVTRLGLSEVTVSRHYRMELGVSGRGAIYLQGVNERTHGIADSLISVLAHRSQEITTDLLERRTDLGALPAPHHPVVLDRAARRDLPVEV